MSEQLDFRYVNTSYDEHVWRLLLEVLRHTVNSIGLKQVAFDLDEQPSFVNHALANRNRCHVKAKWIPYLIRKAPTHRAVEVLAAIRGLEVVERKELTDEEKLERLKDAVRSNVGPRIQREIFEHAFGLKLEQGR